MYGRLAPAPWTVEATRRTPVWRAICRLDPPERFAVSCHCQSPGRYALAPGTTASLRPVSPELRGNRPQAPAGGPATPAWDQKNYGGGQKPNGKEFVPLSHGQRRSIVNRQQRFRTSQLVGQSEPDTRRAFSGTRIVRSSPNSSQRQIDWSPKLSEKNWDQTSDRRADAIGTTRPVAMDAPPLFEWSVPAFRNSQPGLDGRSCGARRSVDTPPGRPRAGSCVRKLAVHPC